MINEIESKYPFGSVGYLRDWRKVNNIEVDKYKEGTLLFVEECYDAFTCEHTIKSVSVYENKDFKESHGGTEGKWQKQYVVNCFDYIGSESFTNDFIFNKKEVKSGDKIYAVMLIEDDYEFIVGIFTEKPDNDICEKYVEHMNSLCPENDEDNKLYVEDYSISRIIELKVV